MRALSVIALSGLAVGCTEDSVDVSCGRGTHLEGDRCVANIDTDTDSDTNTGTLVERRVIGYFVEWGVYDRNYRVADIPAAQLTHVNYAFATITDGECAVYDPWAALELRGGNFAQLVEIKAAYPHLKTLISVGGWTLSADFPEVAATAAGRGRFATSCVDFMLEYGFDGIDIDWEYPVTGGLTEGAAADTENFTLLLRAVRSELDSRAPASLLTIAAPAGSDKVDNLEPAGIAAEVDWINLMTYDFYGGWEPTTNLHNALYMPDGSTAVHAETYNVDASVQRWLDEGVSADQLVVGVPLYGRGWGGVGSTDGGLFQAGRATSEGTWEAGMFDYDDLVENYIGDTRYTRRLHPSARVPTLYSEETGLFISYEDPESLGEKLDLIDALGLGGVMTWELDGDSVEHEMVAVMAERLIGP